MMSTTEEITTTVIYRDGHIEDDDITVISEHILTVTVNERPVYRLICTKDHLRELVIGRLFTDGLIQRADNIERLYFCRYENEAAVFLKDQMSFEEKIDTDLTCCIGNKVYVAAVKQRKMEKCPQYSVKPEWIFDLADEFARDSDLHMRTGGNHICILAREGRSEFICEDIGRHNTVDKAVGYALLNDIPLGECMIFTSGRVPVDMVEKVIMAGIPVLISKSVPTFQSVELAGKYGLNLICRAWQDKCSKFGVER